MIKVTVGRKWLNPKDENKVELIDRNRITVTDENGKHVSGIQSIQINLDVLEHPVLTMKTIDFELDGEFEEDEIMKEVQNEDTPRV